MLPNFTRRKTCGLRRCKNYHMMGRNLGTDAVSGSVRNYKLSDPYEEMHRKFDLFVLHRKTCSSPSVLIINICLDSRIWPRIESWPTSVFMTKWPSFYLKNFKAGNKQFNQKLSSLERGQGLEGEGKAQGYLPPTLLQTLLWTFLQFYIMTGSQHEWPESGQGRIKCKTWRLTFTLSNVML